LKPGAVPSVFPSRQHPPADTAAQQEQDEMEFIDVGADVKVVPSSTSDILSSESETAFTVQVKEIQSNLPRGSHSFTYHPHACLYSPAARRRLWMAG